MLIRENKSGVTRLQTAIFQYNSLFLKMMFCNLFCNQAGYNGVTLSFFSPLVMGGLGN